jgi:RNA polymerase sigma-70 factor (ECF subfamily)
MPVEELRWTRHTLERRLSDLLPPLYRLAHHLGGSRETADDLAQDTFVRAVVAIDAADIRSTEAARGWLVRILVNIYRDEMRRTRRRPGGVAAGGAVDLGLDGLCDTAPTPEEALARKRRDATALRAVAALPEELRIIVVLFYASGLSCEAIGEQLAIPAGTVMSRLARARCRLRAALDARNAESAA